MTMEIEKNHQAESMRCAAIAKIDGPHPAPKVCNDEDLRTGDRGNKDENESDSDSGSITCPLFMEGLPRDFATNPHLAAIASLLDDNDDDDDVREDAKDDKTKEENDVTHNSKHALSHQHRTSSSTPQTISFRHLKSSAKTRNRRRRQRASPYPQQQQDRRHEDQAATKTSSVGEITLFMNMWKP